MPKTTKGGEHGVTTAKGGAGYLSSAQAKRSYDRLGSRQDWQGVLENPGFDELIAHAAFDSAQSIFEFGCGTGRLAARLLQHDLPANARYVGVDISSTMYSLADKRLKLWSERALVHQSAGSPCISQPDFSFDRLVSTYVFDLLSPDFIDQLLFEFHRLLVPGGKLCLVSMTLGTSPVSRSICWCWQRVWRHRPGIVGGCHPIELSEYSRRELWEPDYQARITTWGISSEVLLATARQMNLNSRIITPKETSNGNIIHHRCD